MCRYGFHNYRDHFACFECRKAFKHWQWEPVDEAAFTTMQGLGRVPGEIVCPECKRPMADMGLDFKAPPRADVEQWEILRLLQESGFTFHSCGCGGPGFTPPRTLREVPEWIERRRHRTEAEKLLESFAERAKG